MNIDLELYESKYVTTTGEASGKMLVTRVPGGYIYEFGDGQKLTLQEPSEEHELRTQVRGAVVHLKDAYEKARNIQDDQQMRWLDGLRQMLERGL